MPYRTLCADSEIRLSPRNIEVFLVTFIGLGHFFTKNQFLKHVLPFIGISEFVASGGTA